MSHSFLLYLLVSLTLVSFAVHFFSFFHSIAAALSLMLINSSLHILLFRFLSPLYPFCSNYTSLLGFLLGLPNSLLLHVINLCLIPFPHAAVVAAMSGHAAAPAPPLTLKTLRGKGLHPPAGVVSLLQESDVGGQAAVFLCSFSASCMGFSVVVVTLVSPPYKFVKHTHVPPPVWLQW